MHAIVLLNNNPHTQFEMSSSFTNNSKDVTGAPKYNKNSSRDEIANVNLFTTISHTYFKIPLNMIR